jgi:hypothetical protein
VLRLPPGATTISPQCYHLPETLNTFSSRLTRPSCTHVVLMAVMKPSFFFHHKQLTQWNAYWSQVFNLIRQRWGDVTW